MSFWLLGFSGSQRHEGSGWQKRSMTGAGEQGESWDQGDVAVAFQIPLRTMGQSDLYDDQNASIQGPSTCVYSA